MATHPDQLALFGAPAPPPSTPEAPPPPPEPEAIAAPPAPPPPEADVASSAPPAAAAEEEYPEPGRVTEFDLEFWTFHEANPTVYAALLRFSREALAAGRTSFGIGAVYERARWETAITTNTDDGFKVNHNHRSRYARLLMAREPELRGFFRLRELHT